MEHYLRPAISRGAMEAERNIGANPEVGEGGIVLEASDY